MKLETTLTQNEAEALALLLSRMSFDDFLRLTDGEGDLDQAYFFSGVAAKLREAIPEAIARDEAELDQ